MIGLFLFTVKAMDDGNGGSFALENADSLIEQYKDV